jgi:putative ABC transport system permease protein
MNAARTVRSALTALTANKMRSSLTVLGVVIGVAAVISLMAIGQGSQQAVTENIESLGSNLLFVRSGATMFAGIRGAQGSAGTLTLADAEALADSGLAPLVAAVAPETQTRGQVVAGGQNTNTTVMGVTPEYHDVRNTPVAEGEEISSYHLDRKSMVAVLGSSVAETLFGQASPVGQTIRIEGKQFEVIGVLESKGGTGFGSQDDQILIPITTMQYRLSSQRTASGELSVQTINVQVVDGIETDVAIQQITSILVERHRIGAGEEYDFNISSQEEVIETLEESREIWVVLLGAIAGISLLVGGIGVMNIMLVSVTERTREIGIRKAVGAKRRDILLQFLVEATLMGLIGGGLGVAAGLGVTSLVSGTTLGGTTIETAISANIIILAVCVAVGVGILFGLWPAYRAARLHPIEALRYE